MLWPLLFPGDDLSHAELTAAWLDGDVIDIGEAYMPADAVDTRELRAGSLRRWIRPGLAVTHEGAAWVHGAVPRPPVTVMVQRATPRRPHAVLDVRLRYRDMRLPERDLVRISGVGISTPVRTLVDLVRDRVVRDAEPRNETVDALLRWRPTLIWDALDWLDAAGPIPFKRAARATLTERLHASRGRDPASELGIPGADQPDVAR